MARFRDDAEAQLGEVAAAHQEEMRIKAATHAAELSTHRAEVSVHGEAVVVADELTQLEAETRWASPRLLPAENRQRQVLSAWRGAVS